MTSTQQVKSGIKGADGPPPVVDDGETRIARIALRFTAFSEKWLPDAFGFVLVGTVIVLLLGLLTGEPLLRAAVDPEKPKALGMIDAWGYLGIATYRGRTGAPGLGV